MHKDFLKSKIELGFEQERELLKYEKVKKERLSLLSFVRPIFFATLLTVTLIALAINGFAAIKFFITK
ncbi:hypothetical protein [Enterococcus lactis]|uniref:hypothetical protein n=1 Tax=Enterococcus lactis TaxID=357441 RepID=UPI0034E988BF